MRILALDAATEACSVALWSDGVCIERSIDSGKAHAQQLLRMVTEVLAEAGVALAALDALAASIGPGAFTGVRISVAVAQGLAFGAGLGVVPVSTLEALAFQALAQQTLAAPQPVLAALDARMHEVYWGCFAAHADVGVSALAPSRVDAPSAVVLPASGHYVGIGRGLAAYPQLLDLPGVRSSEPLARALPRARDFARLGALRVGSAVDPGQLQPLYLRDKVAFTEAERLAARPNPKTMA